MLRANGNFGTWRFLSPLRGIFHQALLREYSPWNSIVQVTPLSVDFSHDCSTLFAVTRTTLILFRTACPLGPRLGPVNSAEPCATFPSNTCTRPWLSANIPCQLLSSELYANVFLPL